MDDEMRGRIEERVTWVAGVPMFAGGFVRECEEAGLDGLKVRTALGTAAGTLCCSVLPIKAWKLAWQMLGEGE